MGQPEGAAVSRRRQEVRHVVRARRPHAPLPLLDRREAAERRDEGPVVRPRPVRFLRRATGIGVGGRAGRLDLLHGAREVADRAAPLPHPSRRHGHGTHHEGRRTAQDHDEPGPPRVRGRALEPRPAALALGPRRGRRAARGRLTAPHGARGALPVPDGVALHDPRRRRLRAARAHRQAPRLRRLEEVPRDRLHLRRPGRAHRQRRMGLLVCGQRRTSTRSSRTAATSSSRSDPRSATGPEQDAREHGRPEDDDRRRAERHRQGRAVAEDAALRRPGARRRLGLERRRHRHAARHDAIRRNSRPASRSRPSPTGTSTTPSSPRPT